MRSQAFSLLAMLFTASLTMSLAQAAPVSSAPPAPLMAIVTEDQTRLRASPRDGAQQQAVLSFGEVVEVRGERMDYVQVYDHKRERAGYVRAVQIRRTRFAPEESAELLAVVRFVRDQPGAEALGIGYVAAYLKAATGAEINSEAGAEAFDALGGFAERLARRASSGTTSSKVANATVAAHLELAASYGVGFTSVEQDERMLVCYDGDAFLRVLAVSTHPERRARAALALTRDDCIRTTLIVTERAKIDEWRAELLSRIDTAAAALPAYLKNRVQMRRAGILAGTAYQRVREDKLSAAAVLSQAAISALGNVTKSELTDDDFSGYNDAAMRVNASRWAAEPALIASVKTGVRIVTEAGQAGETCVLLMADANPAKTPLARRCTYGIVWANSASLNREGNALALAVQPMAAWREVWVFRKSAEGWSITALPPASTTPETGYAEFAGWVPGGKQMLIAREARGEGKYKRSFEIIKLDGLTTERQAGDAASLGAFQRWQDARWLQASVSVR